MPEKTFGRRPILFHSPREDATEHCSAEQQRGPVPGRRVALDALAGLQLAVFECQELKAFRFRLVFAS